MRAFSETASATAYRDRVLQVEWQEDPEYYNRYRSRYEGILRHYCRIAPDRPLDVLEVGGGQLALLSSSMWHDRAAVADISDGCFCSLNQRDIETFVWDLALDEPPVPHKRFDAIFFSEVIEHLPIP